jgi:hypothetical protein
VPVSFRLAGSLRRAVPDGIDAAALSGKADATTRSCAFGDAVDHLFELQRRGEIRVRPGAARDGGEEFRRLNDLKVIEADLMAGSGAERAINAVLGARQDGAEALLGLRSLVHIELQLVHALLIEDQHALRAM